MLRAFILATFAVIPPAAAQTATVTEPDGPRYEMRETEEGTVRLDTRSGAVTLCTTDGGKLVCRAAADEREAFLAEIARLDARIDAIEAGRVVSPETEEQVDRAVSTVQRLMKGLAGVVRELRDDADPEPNR